MPVGTRRWRSPPRSLSAAFCCTYCPHVLSASGTLACLQVETSPPVWLIVDACLWETTHPILSQKKRLGWSGSKSGSTWTWYIAPVVANLSCDTHCRTPRPSNVQLALLRNSHRRFRSWIAHEPISDFAANRSIPFLFSRSANTVHAMLRANLEFIEVTEGSGTGWSRGCWQIHPAPTTIIATSAASTSLRFPKPGPASWEAHSEVTAPSRWSAAFVQHAVTGMLAALEARKPLMR